MPSTKPAAQERRKVAVEYEADTPRCYNCKHRSWSKANDLICKLNSFSISPNGLCNTWLGLDGSTLEGPKK